MLIENSRLIHVALVMVIKVDLSSRKYVIIDYS